MGDVWHELARGADALDRGRVVERCELGAQLDVGDCLVVDEHGLAELLATMDDAIAHRANLVQGVDARIRIVHERVDDDTHGRQMVVHGGLDDVHVIAAAPQLMEGIGVTDALTQTLCDGLLGLRINYLIFEGRTTRIDHEYVHECLLQNVVR